MHCIVEFEDSDVLTLTNLDERSSRSEVQAVNWFAAVLVTNLTSSTGCASATASILTLNADCEDCYH